jgi:hypothetical protein
MQRFTVKIAALRVTFSEKRVPPCQCDPTVADQRYPHLDVSSTPKGCSLLPRGVLAAE